MGPGSAEPTVGIPDAIIPVLREHLSIFTKSDPGALVFPGAKGGPLRRGNSNKMSAWRQAAMSVGAEGLHFHDLRHIGNHFAAASGAGLKDLMARMGHDSERGRSSTCTRPRSRPGYHWRDQRPHRGGQAWPRPLAGNAAEAA